MNNTYYKIIYCTAIGDALGLPFEGMSRRRIAKFNKDHSRYHFLFTNGLVSDDTEHSLFVASALANSGEDSQLFKRILRRKLMFWLLSIPVGIGKATLISILKMWLGFPTTKTGYFSAGNGPAMRVALLGFHFKENDVLLEEFVRANTELTHSDPKAFTAAMAVAKMVQLLATDNQTKPESLLIKLKGISDCSSWQNIIQDMQNHFMEKKTLETFCKSQNISNGVSGYCYHSVPVAIYAILINNFQLKKTLEDLIKAGGDTDSNAAIAGAILGTLNPHVDQQLIDNLLLFPYKKQTINQLADSLEKNHKHPGVPAFGPLILLRNLGMVILVFIHLFRRMLPPY